jgi:hypothetical protein
MVSSLVLSTASMCKVSLAAYEDSSGVPLSGSWQKQFNPIAIFDELIANDCPSHNLGHQAAPAISGEVEIRRPG